MTETATSPKPHEPFFFSYAHEDRDHAAAIIAALEEEGISVWWDDHLDGGTAYANSIESALGKATAVIVLWSDRAVQSHWVLDEAEHGRANNQLIPLKIGKVDPPLGFRQLHFIDMEGWRGDRNAPEFRRLMRAVAGYIDGETPKLDAAAPRPTPSMASPSRRTLLLAGGAVGGVAVLGGLGFSLFNGRSSALIENGLAVLPFRNLSGDPSHEYLSAGLAAEVRATLARNAALRIVAQASSEAVREQSLGAAEMARTLSVAFLLDGNVTRIGDEIRIGADLIDGETGFSRWTQSFNRPVSEFATIQEAIANAVIGELAFKPNDEVDGNYGQTEDAAAFDDYLKGNELYASAVSLETDLEALAKFDSAIARDPNFGAAHAARARTLTVLGNTSDSVERAKLYYESARAAAEKAVDTGPMAADAHSTLGFVMFQAQLNIAAAHAPFEKSFELGKGDARVLARYASFAACTKKSEQAKRAIDMARDLDPLNANIHRIMGTVQYAAGNYAGVIDSLDRALKLNPDLSDSHARVAMAQIALDLPEEALNAAQKERSGMMRYPALAIAHHRLGNDAMARQALDDLVANYGDAGLYQQAQVLARQGDADAAMQTLRKAYASGDSGLVFAWIDPSFEILRQRTDYKDLLSTLGFM